ncbi:hypothetical protein GCM10011511_52550 [Puia dinghuensis]|uniref:Tail specific protease domain-containing protein n=2 Tax=Puia dinghuensis TaxID=1792502 RepID=A0A8J2XVZ2_9BACT|nr:hypothetical protein GCM10011511_52550 [Puia dinghuensis]
MYRYKTKKELDGIWDSCYASITDSMTVPGFYALTSFAIASLEDGHSNCRLPQDATKEYISHVSVFPAIVMFINNHGYIYCCKQNDSLAGSEIMEINGRPMSQIIHRLFDYIPSDAGIQSRKNWELPEYFNILFNLVFGKQRNYEVSYKTIDGKIARAKLEARLLSDMMCPPPALFKRPTRYLQLSYRPGDIALLTIKTFFNGFLQQTGENFSSFLDSAFNDIRLKKTRKLIIDIRRNQGGNDENGALLYAYLSQKPFRYYDSLEKTKGKLPGDSHQNLQLQQPKPNSFDGRLFILADGRSFSASSEFSSIVKTNNRGIFIGEENGGGYYGNTSGDDENVILPASQISCRIPLVKYTLAVKKLKNGDLGILPDFPCYITISDILSNTDSQLQYAIKKASSN